MRFPKEKEISREITAWERNHGIISYVRYWGRGVLSIVIVNHEHACWKFPWNLIARSVSLQLARWKLSHRRRSALIVHLVVHLEDVSFKVPYASDIPTSVVTSATRRRYVFHDYSSRAANLFRCRRTMWCKNSISRRNFARNESTPAFNIAFNIVKLLKLIYLRLILRRIKIKLEFARWKELDKN